MISKELTERLMHAGLTKTQATSVTADTLVNLLLPDDGKYLVNEAQAQVKEMKEMILNLREQYYEYVYKLENLSATIKGILEAKAEYGTVTEEKAKNAIALYAALLHMNEKAGADGNDATRNASYILYAYLGGQAKRDVSYSNEPRPVQ